MYIYCHQKKDQNRTITEFCHAPSSTPCDACQKNKYGLIVVPNIATMVDHASWLFGHEGVNVSCNNDFQSVTTRKAVIAYANRTRHSHLRTSAIWWYRNRIITTVI